MPIAWRGRYLSYFALTLILITSNISLAQEKTQRSDIMTIAELEGELHRKSENGEKLYGYGKTVLEGAKIEKFDVEIIDVMKNVFPKQDLILIRCKGARLEFTGVIAGMSGSPIFVNDKVIGALAYGWSFTKEPIAGVQPIEYMLEIIDRPLEKKTGFNWKQSPSYIDNPNSMRPVSTPLVTSGFTSHTMDMAGEYFKDSQLFPVMGGSGSGGYDTEDIKLEPGSAIGVQMIGGDYSMAGIGTVSYVDGEKVLAFGHPMFGEGEVDMPITTAVIHTILPSQNRSFKLGSPIDVVGGLIQDRANAIYGKVGLKSKMIPLSIEVKNPKIETSKTVNLTIMNHKNLTPLLILIALTNTIDQYEPYRAENTMLGKWSIKLKGYKEIRFEDTYNAGGLMSAVFSKFYEFLSNEYQFPLLESVNLTVETVNEARLMRIKHAWLAENEVEDGGVVTINLLLKQWRGAEKLEKIELQLPKGLRNGSEVKIKVGGGASVAAEVAPPTNFDEYVDALFKFYKANAIVAVADLPSYNLKYKGRILDKLPHSFAAQILPALTDDFDFANDTVRKVIDTDYVISGTKEVTVKIKK